MNRSSTVAAAFLRHAAPVSLRVRLKPDTTGTSPACCSGYLRGAGPWIAIGATMAIAAFILVVTVLACVVPARRALRIQPTEALRAE